MKPTDRHDLLQQIAAISTMERGKLSTYSPNAGPAAAGPYFKLQRWENGENHTRHVPSEDVPAVEAALAGFAQYKQLTEQYAQLVITETRAHIADSKKNCSRPRSFSPKKKKSNN